MKVPEKSKPDHYFSNKPTSKYQEFKISAILRNRMFEFYTAPGVFSSKKVDLGTSVLIKQSKIPDEGIILDMGCGYGPVGIVFGVLNPIIQVHFMDINQRSLDLAKKNAQLNKITNYRTFTGDCKQILKKNQIKYQAIYYNPPIKMGQENYLNDIITASEYLEDNGMFYIVIKKSLGAQGAFDKLAREFEKDTEKPTYEMDIIAKNSGYWIITIKKTTDSN